MNILNDLVEEISNAEVMKREDGTWSLIVSPKIVENIFAAREKVDSVERTLRTLNNAVEDKQDSSVGVATRATCLTILGLME